MRTLGAKAEQKGRDNAGGRLREGRLGKWEGQGMEHGGRNKFRTALATPLCARMSETVPTPEIIVEGETG